MNDKLITQVRKIASRGRMDDADVQILFDLADYAASLEGTLVQKQILLDQVPGVWELVVDEMARLIVEVDRCHRALGQQTELNRRLIRQQRTRDRKWRRMLDQQVEATRRLRDEVDEIVERKVSGRLSILNPTLQSVPSSGPIRTPKLRQDGTDGSWAGD